MSLFFFFFCPFADWVWNRYNKGGRPKVAQAIVPVKAAAVAAKKPVEKKVVEKKGAAEGKKAAKK